MVRGRFTEGSIHAWITSRIKRQYLAVILVSPTLHSRFAWHSSMSGAWTRRAAAGVRPKAANLSVFAPEVLPQATTFAANSTVGMFMTHSFAAFKMPNV